MIEFELWISGDRSDRSTNCATTTNRMIIAHKTDSLPHKADNLDQIFLDH